MDPVKAGYAADVDYALDGALLFGRAKPVPPEGATVPLRQSVNRKRLRAVLALRAAKYDVPAKDAGLGFNGANPVVSKPRVGVAIDLPKAARSVEQAILARDRLAYALRPSAYSGRHLGRSGDHHRAQPVPAHPVACGEAAHVRHRRRPGRLPDAQRHLQHREQAGEPDLVPAELALGRGPGPRAAGREQPARHPVDGHLGAGDRVDGTPTSGSIGTAASHGCIRMYIGDAEYLFDQIRRGDAGEDRLRRRCGWPPLAGGQARLRPLAGASGRRRHRLRRGWPP